MLPSSIPVLQLNESYDFVSSFKSIDECRERIFISDPLWIVCTIDTGTLMIGYCFFTVRQLTEICTDHRVPLPSPCRRTSLMHKLQYHVCTNVCRDILYVFNERRKAREYAQVKLLEKKLMISVMANNS